MLGRLAPGCLDMLNSFRCRCSFSLRSIHLAANHGRTETLTHPDENPISPPAAGPRWVMLSLYLSHRGNLANAKMVAESRISTGRGFRVSAHLAAPPASSYLCYDWEGSGTGSGDERDYTEVLAAQGDSVLFRITSSSGYRTTTEDYFVYRAGASAAATPASLSLLPTNGFSESPSPQLKLYQRTTGVLRRSDDEVLVIELRVRTRSDAPQGTVDLNVLRIGSSEWEMRWAVPIILADGSRDEIIMTRWGIPDRAVPVGSRFMCWVHYDIGFLICDMADPNLMLRSLPLPVAPRENMRSHGRYISDDEEDYHIQYYCRNMCGVGADALRFVSIDPRCCCGGPGRGTCPHSSFAFTVTTWTMNLTMDEQMTWVKDSVLDCKELWDLPEYEGLPCVPPDFPIVSPDNPDNICFNVSNRRLLESSYDEEKVWMLEVDTRNKVVLSVLQCTEDTWDHFQANF